MLKIKKEYFFLILKLIHLILNLNRLQSAASNLRVMRDPDQKPNDP